jgi:hypothetical protein
MADGPRDGYAADVGLWSPATSFKASGQDFKLVVHARVMPARRGHQVVCVLQAGRLVGLHNLNTGDAANFAGTDPPLLWRRCDGAAVVLLVAASAVAGCASWFVACAFACLIALMLVSSVVIGRWLKRRALVRAIDYAIDSAKAQATGQPRLKRVK